MRTKYYCLSTKIQLMKQFFLLVSISSTLFACNTHSDNHSVKEDTSTHAGHDGSTADTTHQDQPNPVTATMDKMMHGMHAAKPTGNNEIDFSAMMVEHHKGAVEMAQVELAKGSNAELKGFAEKLVADQNKEIAFMQDFIANNAKTNSANSAAFQKALNNSMMAMMSGNTTIYNNIDKDFAAQMIPHHQSAVDMAKAYLQYGKEKSLTTLCQNIIASQSKEIDWLQAWLTKNK